MSNISDICSSDICSSSAINNTFLYLVTQENTVKMSLLLCFTITKNNKVNDQLLKHIT